MHTISLVCRSSSSLTANAMCLVLITVSSNFSRPSSCSVETNEVAHDGEKAYIQTLSVHVLGGRREKGCLILTNVKERAFHDLSLKTNNTIVVKTFCSGHGINRLNLRPKQAVPIGKVWHVQCGGHLVYFWSQICKHVFAAIHFFLCPANQKAHLSNTRRKQPLDFLFLISKGRLQTLKSRT